MGPSNATEASMLNKPKPFVRPLALGIIRRPDGRVLMERGRDDVRDETYWRIIGGGIEFQESAAAAFAREVKEELDEDVTDVRFVGVLENIFTLNGAPGHEIIMVHEARFRDERAYEREVLTVREHGQPDGEARWIDHEEARRRGEPVHPISLVESGWLNR
jgi:ADP-ribose pyrophosphatase YjhB (NUDIX family)